MNETQPIKHPKKMWMFPPLPSLPNTTSRIELNKAMSNIRQIYPSTKKMSMYRPTTFEEAIAYATIQHKIDISFVENPLEELKRILTSLIEKGEKTLSIDNYESSDVQMQNRLKSKPVSLYSPFLDQVFNPCLSSLFYDSSTLRRFIFNRGYTIKDIGDSLPYDFLIEKFLLNSFYHGIIGPYANDDTCI